MPGAYEMLKNSADVFLYPGHVNAITGNALNKKLCEEEGINVDDTVCVDRDINYRYEGAKDLAYLERNLFRYKGGVYTGTPENIRIYEGSNPKEELQYIVSEILQLTRKEGFR